MDKEKLLKYFFIFLSIIISVSIIVFKNELIKLANFGYLGVFLINLIGSATVIMPAPSLVATFIGGSIYNPLLVGVFSGIGASIGELTGYLAGYGGSVFITENKNYKKVKKWMQKSGFLTIFTLSLLPNPLFDFAGIFSGASKYSCKKFMLATTLGKTIRFVAIALIGKNVL